MKNTWQLYMVVPKDLNRIKPKKEELHLIHPVELKFIMEVSKKLDTTSHTWRIRVGSDRLRDSQIEVPLCDPQNTSLRGTEILDSIKNPNQVEYKLRFPNSGYYMIVTGLYQDNYFCNIRWEVYLHNKESALNLDTKKFITLVENIAFVYSIFDIGHEMINKLVEIAQKRDDRLKIREQTALSDFEETQSDE